MKSRALVAVGVVALAAAGIAEARRRVAEPTGPQLATHALTGRLASVKKAEGMILDKLGKRTSQVRRRVRSLYKLMRAGPAPLWVEPSERAATVRRRAAAVRILRRDFRELALLRDELRSVQAAGERLRGDQRKLAAVVWPKPRSLVSPVDGRIRVAAAFGHFAQTKPQPLSLTRRGIGLRVKKHARVYPVGAGRVRFVGRIRGLGTGVIVQHDGFVSVVGPVARATVTRLQQVSERTVLGVAAADQLYIEVRVPVGASGLPVDPAPLLRKR